MQITDELRVVVEAEVDRAIKNFEKLNSTVDKSKKKTQTLSEALDKIAKPAMVLSTALGASGVAAVKFAGELEQTQLALEVLLKDAEKATAIKDEWVQLAASTPFSSADIDSAGKKLLAFNIESEKVTDTLRRIGDISAATGSSISEIADIYGKAAVQGRLFAEDINQFQGRGIPVVQALAKVLNVAETEIRGMVTEGKIGFPELEKAFQFMTNEGGQFSGMMEKLSESTLGKFSTTMDNAKLALASFGEVMQPTANALLDFANDFFEGIQNMDEGTKAFVVGFSSIVAISGPTILAIKGIKVALAGLAANPVVLAIAGVTAGVATLGGAIAALSTNAEKNKRALEENENAYRGLLQAYEQENEGKAIDAELTAKLIELYPDLTKELIANKTTVEEAAKALEEYNEQQAIMRSAPALADLSVYLADYKNAQQTIADGWEIVNKAKTKAEALARKQEFVDPYLESLDEAKFKVDLFAEDAKRQLALIGKTLDENFNIVDMPKVEIEVEADVDVNPPEPKPEEKKKWQEWFKEVTGVKDNFTLGVEAGKLYVDGLEEELKNAQALSEALGEKFDMNDFLKGQMSDIKAVIEELLSIPADEINLPFELIDDSIEELIKKYKVLAEKTKDVPKEAFDSWDDYVRDWVSNIFDEFQFLDKSMKGFAQDMMVSLASVTLDSLVSGLEDVGEALGKGEDGASAFKSAMTTLLQTMINNLPTLLLNAGLQLIGTGNWQIGLALIGMSGLTALTKGFVNGSYEDVEANAKGGVYGASDYTAFAKGGAFTNAVVDTPTFFKFAKGSGFGNGLMGEAGPEAIMPLKRSSDGSLGVDATGVGGTTNVIVEINNYTSEEISTTETENSDGQKTIQVTIGKMINAHLSQGKADKVMSARYGVNARGV